VDVAVGLGRGQQVAGWRLLEDQTSMLHIRISSLLAAASSICPS
jgi:hypothetical protein